MTDTVGSLTQTGVLTVAGTSSFTTSATNADITLTGANLLTGAVSLITHGTSGNASLTNNQATVLDASDVRGTLTVMSSLGDLSQSGALTVTGASSFTTSAANTAIALTNAGNLLTGAVSLNTSGGGGNAQLTNGSATVLGASNVGGSLTVTDTVGNLTQTAALTVGGTSSFTTSAANATITLTNIGNQLTGAVALATNGGTGNASLTNNLATVLGASNIGGNLVVTDRVGNLTQTGALTVGGTSAFTTSTANATITLNDANLLTGAVSLTASGAAGDAQLTNGMATVLGASTVGGTLTVTDTVGNLTQSGATVLTVTGASSFTTSAADATITLNNANQLTGAVSLNTNGASGDASLTNNRATVLGTSDVGGNLTVTASAGSSLTQLVGTVLTVTGTSSFTTTANNADITLTNANLLTGAVSLNTSGGSGNASLTNNLAGGLVLGTSTVGGTLTVTDTVGNLTQSGATVLTVTGASSFTTSATDATIALTSANLLTGAVLLNTSGAGGNAQLSNAASTVLGASTVGGNLTVRTDSINVTGTISASGQTMTLAPLTAATTMGLGTGAGALALSQTELNNITAATLVFGSASATGAMTVGGTVTLSSSITNLSLLSGSSIAVASGGSLSDTNASSSVLLQAANLALGGPVSVNGANSVLTLNTTGTATQSAAITALNLALLGTGGSYTLNSAGNLIGTLAANTGSVNLTSDQAVTVGEVGGVTGWTTAGNSVLTASGGVSDITVSNPVNWGNSTLTLAAGRNVAINAAMTGGTAGDLTATANGSLTIGAAGSVTGRTVALSAIGAFTNNRGSDAVTASDRWLVYSSAPDAAGENFGSLNSNNTAIWNSTYATLPPASVTLPGNRYIFATAAAPATLTFTSLNDSKTYGDTASVSLYTVSGFRPGVANAYLPDSAASAFTGAPVLASAGTGATADAATYGIAISQGTLASSNGYSFAFNSTGLLTVNPKALMITANNGTQTYDKVAFSGGNGVVYSGFVNGENSSVLGGAIVYGGTSQGAVNAGTYTIIPSNQTSSNYAINYVGGTLTINKAPITVSANSQTKFIGNPDPPLTYEVTNGTLFGNDFLSGALARAAGQGLGTYPITEGSLASSNYDIAFVGSTLAIEPNPAGMIAASSVINSSNIIPGFYLSFPGDSVLPYGNDTGSFGSNSNQQTSDSEFAATGDDSRIAQGSGALDHLHYRTAVARSVEQAVRLAGTSSILDSSIASRRGGRFVCLRTDRSPLFRRKFRLSQRASRRLILLQPRIVSCNMKFKNRGQRRSPRGGSSAPMRSRGH